MQLSGYELRRIPIPRTWVNRDYRQLDCGARLSHAVLLRERSIGRLLQMDTLLTLVIAVGGIATGIGAIWTAVAARRQAQLTERSLTEHNERLRLNLEVDLLHRMQGRYDSQLFIGRRSAAARYFLDNAFVDDNMVEVERLNDAAIDVCDFFESLAYLQSIDALSAKSVWNNFSGDVRLHWAMCKSGIEKMREERQDPTLVEEFERLSRLMDDMDRERGIPDPTPEQLHRVLEEKAVRGEEPPTTATEGGHLPKRR